MDSKYAVRDELVGRLRGDLVGPHEEHEELTDAPFATYISGVLYPQTAGLVDQENEVDEHDDAGETTYADPPVSLANARYPSSAGLTFAVDTTVSSEITCVVSTARYVLHGMGDEQRWRRLPLRFEETIAVDRRSDGDERELEPGLDLYVRVRPADSEGVAAVTLVLINRREAPRFEKDAHSYYQAGLEVEAAGGAVFAERGSDALQVDDADLETYRLIYRHVRSFAVGHGTSVEWDVPHEAADRATAVRTVAVPGHELLLADSNPDIRTDGLTMLGLSTSSRADVAANLRELADGYASWIAARRKDADSLDAALQDIAGNHLADCDTTLERMRSGISRLEREDDVWLAFQLANVAMLRQRARSAWIAAGRPDPGPAEDETHRWRPFQMAFILLNLDGIAEPEHDDRELLDLLWFPTGGGKTEAYLGLIAFTVLLRRLRRRDLGRGVTVLMRYTLRLLTIQQFERAASLICALEALRLERDDLGTSPISIGLWVGKDGTPATLQDARAALDKIRVGTIVEKGNPVQVRACPWCGQKLDHKAYWIAQSNPRLVISCRNKDCTFSGGLPIHVVDEDVYREQPSLIIATADKFATLPWVRGAHALFAVDERIPAPELIVQDELHLISGPLGTLAGLYEAAIDLLCTEGGVRPKVIASTATIRRAGPQTRSLFDRSMRQFPPPGIDADDSFFAVTAPRNRKAARLYVGAMAPGTSQSTLMIRAYAALLQGIADVEAAPEDRDPYWTLVGYFNSLRVLGGARIQVLDDVRERMTLIADSDEPRDIGHQIELTSREPSSAIPGHLEALTVEHPDAEALDYVLATNMISVGVDIDRLGLMVVMGQPQATAEYIQATSRVGRQYPGLILTLFNAGRSRDRSHYESFPTYHSALYRQVESTSVTPFSPRARDRALHAVLLSLVRTKVPDMRDNAGAREVADHLAEIKHFVGELAARADRVDPGTGDAVREQLESILEAWVARSTEAPKLVYANPRDAVNSLLASADQAEGDGLPTPSSLRDVDRESNL